MTIAPPAQHNSGKDEEVDRRIDVQIGVQIDGRKAARKDDAGPPLGSAYVVALANHKGGVTKTTSTANLGAMLAEAGRRVLIVDCDPQANLSEAFGWGARSFQERGSRTCSHIRTLPAATPRRWRSSRASRPGRRGESGCGSSRRPTRSPTSLRTCRHGWSGL
jgi:hypothetical protein